MPNRLGESRNHFGCYCCRNKQNTVPKRKLWEKITERNYQQLPAINLYIPPECETKI